MKRSEKGVKDFRKGLALPDENDDIIAGVGSLGEGKRNQK